ncbi:MAG TPA: MFS transporter [Candidatus Limnocylindrales bacterium]|nr:MFS transporter [Candidatus Limnocylindrales bacterium]
MGRLTAIALLGVFGAGVFLAGLELMITAVALPSIVTDLADWTHLRTASWIVNGYLLVYVVAMPLAGRLTDVWGSRRLFLAALAVFTVGSALAGRAQSLEELIAARLVQAAGGGALVPVATAAASHLFDGHARPRALGVVGALTFLGMAAGPFLGAAILSAIHVEGALARASLDDPLLLESLAPAWRWVFYLNVPVGIAALAIAWAASHGWDTPRRNGRVDVLGAVVFSIALAAGLIALTLIGAEGGGDPGDVDPAAVTPWLAAIAAVATLVAVAAGLRRSDPFLDPRLFRIRAFSSAAIVSLLTGYGLATAIVGGAVFVDRVLYGGPAQQQVALGALAGATALGALVSGFALRVVSLRLITIAGLGASTAALAAMAGWTPSTPLDQVAIGLGIFGFGFGLTVTPRSTAAVEAVGRAAFGAASATVTVARMVGMAVGLAVLTAYGSTTIDRLYDEVYATPDAYTAFIPAELRDRPLRDGLVVQALEDWAAGEAARIMVGIFLVAAGLTAAAAPAALAMGERTAHAAPGSSPRAAGAAHGDGVDGRDDTEPSLAL